MGNAQSGQDVVYWVNDLDEICFVNEAYDEFAERNDADAVRSHRVLNRSLWDFIGDRTTQELYRRALMRVRLGRKLRFDFRCDAPGYRRTMQLQMACLESGTVEFRVSLLHEEQRAVQTLLERPVGHSQYELHVCCFCKKVLVGDIWLEVEEAAARLHLFSRPYMPALRSCVCTPCHDLLLRILRA